MAIDLQIPYTWRRIEVGPDRFTPGVYRTGDIVLPAVHRAPDLSVELSGLLPNRDHNGDLLRAIERMTRCLTGERPVIGVFASDPFLRVDQMVDRLKEKGYTDVTNLPSVTQYGRAYTPVLDDLDVGANREIRTLSEFRKRGFSVSVAVTASEAVPQALGLHPRHLFVVPSFDFWDTRKLDPDRLSDVCREIAHCRDRLSSEASVVMIAGRMAISPTHARDAGADGVLLD